MKGLDATERAVVETLASPSGSCNADYCGDPGGAGGGFTSEEVLAVRRLLERGLAYEWDCAVCPGQTHVSITPEGLHVLSLVRASDRPLDKP